VAQWPEAVGEAIARNAWPSRISRDGTLHVATTDSVWAFELGQRSTEIAGRLGVTGVRFAPGPVPAGELAPEVPAPIEPTAEQQALARALAAELSDENLRKSVQKAVLFSLVRGAADRPLW
jgi:hypothetical protein